MQFIAIGPRIAENGTGVNVACLTCGSQLPNAARFCPSCGDPTSALAARERGGGAAEALRTSEAVYHSLVEALPQSIFRKDLKSRFTFANQRFCATLGRSLGEIVGKNDYDFYPPELAEKYVLDDLRVLESGQSLETVEAHRTPAGQELFVRVIKTPIFDRDGSKIGTQCMFWDVTQEHEVARLKDELVSVVSHELRTPLASLVGFAELLLNREFSEERRRQFLTVMYQEGRRLTALINDFLDLQRMESGRQQIAPLPIDAGPILRQAIDVAGEDLDRPVRLELPTDLPAVLADAERLKQVLTNLLSNARKYSPAGGEIALQASSRDGQLEIGVRDRGLGIPSEAMPRLFEKFYRVDNTDRRTIQGTGLGLAICRKIIDAHGGRIWAESEGLGHGARFAFTLPLARSVAQEGDVLVVENDLGFAHLLEVELAARGHSSLCIASAEAAQQQIASVPPRAIVLDLLLPGLQGEDLLAWVRQGPAANTPVIVVTVKDLDSDAQRSLERLQVIAILRKGPGVAAAAADTVARVLQPVVIPAG